MHTTRHTCIHIKIRTIQAQNTAEQTEYGTIKQVITLLNYCVLGSKVQHIYVMVQKTSYH